MGRAKVPDEEKKTSLNISMAPVMKRAVVKVAKHKRQSGAAFVCDLIDEKLKKSKKLLKKLGVTYPF